MTGPYLLARVRSRIGRWFDRSGALGRRVWHLRLNGPFPRLRTHRAVTRVLGPQYARSRRRIEIDLTYACNLACANCNRSVPQAPATERMTPARIAAFIEESVRGDARWERIRLLGGEPTLHPQFFEILDQLRAYRDGHSPRTAIEVTSNGFGPKVAAALARIPPDVRINASPKDEQGAEQSAFVSFNVAPRDLPAYGSSDFANGCRIASDCGMGLGPSGYYPCAVAAGIDRVLGAKAGRTGLPAPDDEMRDQMRLFCGWCGHFKRDLEAGMPGQQSSRSWRDAYAAYAARGRARRQSGAPSA